MVELWDTVRSTEGSQGPNEERMRSAKQNQDLRSRDCISRSDMAQRALGYGAKHMFLKNIKEYLLCINC